MTDGADWSEKRNTERETYCIHAFRSAVCTQNSIQRVLQVAKPHNVLDEVKAKSDLSLGNRLSA